MAVQAPAAARAAWTVRPARTEDVPAIVELFRATFGRPASEDWYRWKHLDSPWPLDAPAAFVATHGDRVIAHYGGTPLRFRAGGRTLPGLHGCDMMVAPEFRRRGVMTAVGEAAHAAWAGGGVHLVLGIPPEHWGGLRDRLDYRRAVELGWLWRPLRPAALVRRNAQPRLAGGGSVDRLAARGWDRAWSALLGRAARGVEVSAVAPPGSELDALWDELAGRYGALVVRDRAWVSYRYTASGLDYRTLLASAGGRPTGYLVYRLFLAGRGRASGWIADVFTAPEDRAARAALLRACFRELLDAGAADVRIFSVRHAPLARELRRVGFVRRSGAFDVGVVPLVPDLPWDVLRDPRRFLVAGGDFDVV